MPGTSPLSVGSLLNTSQHDAMRLTPTSSELTDSSDAASSNVSGPLAAVLRGRSVSPRVDLLSGYIHHARLRGAPDGAYVPPLADAQTTRSHVLGAHNPYGPPPPHAVNVPPPLPPHAPYHPALPPGAYATNLWQRQPPGGQYPPQQFQVRHGPMHPHHAMAHRYAPYPQPPPYMAHPAAASYYVHPGVPPPPPPVPLPMYPGPGGSRIPWRRERRSKACLRCHTKKIKCEGEGPTCEGCKLTGSECQWVEMKKRGPKPKRDRDRAAVAATAAASAEAQDPDALVDPPDSAELRPGTPDPSHAATAAPEPPAGAADVAGLTNGEAVDSDEDVPAVMTVKTATMEQALQRFHSDCVPGDLRDAVACFLEHLYPQFPIFHPATLVRRVAFGQIEPLLADALRLCTARIVARQPGLATDVGALRARLHRRLLAGVEQPSLDYVRAVLLSASLLEGDAQFLMYSSLAGLAASTAMRLGWQTLDLGRSIDEVPWEEWVDLEEKRRTFWCVYQLDSHHGLLSDRPVTVAKTHIFISTPGPDPAWDEIGAPQSTRCPTLHQPDMRRDVAVRTGALTHAFIEHCNLAAIKARLSEFLWEARADVYVPPGDGGWSSGIPFMPLIHAQARGDGATRPVRALADYPEFRQLHSALHEWSAGLVPAEDMARESCAPARGVEHVGLLEHRRHAMRLRYFSLRCQFTSTLHLLHFANRPSLVDPGRQPRRKFGLVAAFEAVTVSDDEQALRSTMARTLAELHNDGLLAYDIADESWAVCLREAYALLDHLEANSDIPAERLDPAAALSLLTSCTVFIRHVRMCRARTARGGTAAPDASVPGVDPGRQLAAHHGDAVQAARATAALGRMWAVLQAVGRVWRVQDAENVLRAMHIDEVIGMAR